MNIFPTESFKKDYDDLPNVTQRKIEQKLFFLSTNLRHPSLRVKKMKGMPDVWEARVDRFYRITFAIEANTIYLYRVGPHDEVLKLK